MLASPRFKWNDQLAAAAINAPALWPGARGTGVHLIQFALLDLGYEMPRSTGKTMSPDGIYGSETKAVVQDFQRKHELEDDGVVGGKTMAELDKVFAKHTHEVRLHFRSLAVSPLQPFEVLLNGAQVAFDQYGIRLRSVSAQCLELSEEQRAMFDVIDGECNWDITEGEYAELHKLGGFVPPHDISVYIVNDIAMPDVTGCGGHVPGRPAVTIAAYSYRWVLAHEICHVLLTKDFIPKHWKRPENLMWLEGHSNNPVPVPVLSDLQVHAMRKSHCCRPI